MRHLGRCRRAISCFIGLLIPTIAAGRLGLGESGEIEIGDRLKRLGHGGSAQAVGQRGKPIGILGLQPQQHVGRVIPALETAAPVDRPTCSGRDGRGLLQPSCAIDLMSVSGPGDPGREVKARNLPWTAKGGALGTSMSVLTASA